MREKQRVCVCVCEGEESDRCGVGRDRWDEIDFKEPIERDGGKKK